MTRFLLGAAILLVSSAGTFGRGGSPTDRNSTTNTQSAQPSGESHTIEGCLSSAVDDFVLTDAKGKTYAVVGDIAQLTARVGHQVRLWGHADNTREPEWVTAGGPHAAFTVEKVEELSAACK